MKKILFYIAAAVVTIASCNKLENITTSDSSTIYILKAKVENYLTKGTYDSVGKFTWAEGDKIGVYMTDGTYTWTEPLTIKEGDGGKTEATFTTTRDI